MYSYIKAITKIAMSKDPLKIGIFSFGRWLTGSLLVIDEMSVALEAGSELCGAPETGGVGTNFVTCTSSGHVEICGYCSKTVL